MAFTEKMRRNQRKRGAARGGTEERVSVCLREKERERKRKRSSDAVQRPLDRAVLRRVRTTAIVGGCNCVRTGVRRNERRVQLRLD